MLQVNDQRQGRSPIRLRFAGRAAALFLFLNLPALPAFAQGPCLQIFCPQSLVVECQGMDGAFVDYGIVVSNQCQTQTILECTPTNGSWLPMGQTLVHALAKDNQGHEATCDFTVYVVDIHPPQIFSLFDFEVPCDTWQGAAVNFFAGAYDNCSGPVTVEMSPPSGTVFPNGVTVVSCIATDTAGNKAEASFRVTVTGDCGADCVELTCPADLVVDATTGSSAEVSFAAQATHLCGGTATITYDPEPGSAFPIGSNVVFCQATDGFGNSDACSFTITVQDRVPPTLLLPEFIQLPCDSPNGSAKVQFNIVALDNVDSSPVVSCQPPSGSFFQPGTSVVTCTAVDAAGNSTSDTFRVVVVPGSACGVSAPLPDASAGDNWGFELGLTGWASEGSAFAGQPIVGHAVDVSSIPAIATGIQARIGGDYWRNVAYPIGHKGTQWVGSAHNQTPGLKELDGSIRDERTGVLVSKPFVIANNFITFLVGGDNDAGKLNVQLWEIVNGSMQSMLRNSTGHDDDRMRREWWDVAAFKGKTVRVRITDSSDTGHIQIDDFQFRDIPPSQDQIDVGVARFPVAVFEDGIWRDWDASIWGVVDLHTHPMSHLGFGRKVFHGMPDGDITVALSECGCTHGGPGIDNLCGNYFREAVSKGMDSEGPDPHRSGYDANPWIQYTEWPVFTTISHQQMWYEWINRAYDGGLRVMVALCVNNQLLASAALGERPFDDVTVGNNQIQALKDFVDAHTNFMEIAYDPSQLRSIARRNKLAIIIGSELDDIGNFNSINNVTPDMVRAEIRRLYDLGVRYIFPIHLVNNRFGGAAVYNQLFNVANKFMTGAPLAVSNAPPADGINFELKKLDLLGAIPEGPAIAFAITGPLVLPALASPLADVVVSTFQPGFPPGTASGMMGAIGPTIPAIMGAIFPPAAAAVAIYLDDAGLPVDVLPIGGNYPNYPATSSGHMNVQGITTLGEHAIREMMRLGMIIDVDHASQNTVAGIMEQSALMEELYPLNSGHNTFRDVRFKASENNRSASQLEFIRDSGGIMGIGYGNEDMKSVDSVLSTRAFTESVVLNNSAGSSRTFAQSYIYAVEKMGGCQVALGTDINGFVVGPGPRFGPQGAFGLLEHGPDRVHLRRDQIAAQYNGVAYAPVDGMPILGAAFDGRSVDGSTDTGDARVPLGYAYNKEQRDFFVAIRLFKSNPAMTKPDAAAFESVISGNYDRRRVKEFLIGLLIGVTDEAPGSDFLDGDVETKQQLAKAVFRLETLGEPPPGDVLMNDEKRRRFGKLQAVWIQYNRIYGDNVPLTRCQTGNKEWDINFEGVAHYGLLPDFFQDLRNVGMTPNDLEPLFNGAECFARMWTKCLECAGKLTPRFSTSLIPPLSNTLIRLSYIDTAGEYRLETGRNITQDVWNPVALDYTATNGLLTEVRFDLTESNAFFRLRRE